MFYTHTQTQTNIADIQSAIYRQKIVVDELTKLFYSSPDQSIVVELEEAELTLNELVSSVRKEANNG